MICLGFLFAGYEDEYVYWEAVVLARKAALSAGAVFLAFSGTTVQVVVAILMLVLCYALQMNCHPLEHDWHDLLEERSLVASALILIACLLGNAGSAGKNELDGSASVAVSVFVFLITCWFLITSMRLTLIGMHQSGEDRVAVRCATKILQCCSVCCFAIFLSQKRRQPLGRHGGVEHSTLGLKKERRRVQTRGTKARLEILSWPV